MPSGERHIRLLMLSDLAREPRVYRQLKILAPHYTITTAGYAPSEEKVFNHWKIDPYFCNVGKPSEVKPSDFSFLPTLLAKSARRTKVYANRLKLKLLKIRKAVLIKFKNFSDYYWSQSVVSSVLDHWESAGKPTFDLVIVHDQELLPVALQIAAPQPVLLDAHEYYPAQMSTLKFNLFLKDYRHWICSQYMPQVAAMTTVSQGVANEYQRVYGIQPELVFNAPFYQTLVPQPVNPGKVRLVHHGIPSPERGLEKLIEMFHTLDNRFTLDFYLMRNQSPDYLSMLE